MKKCLKIVSLIVAIFSIVLTLVSCGEEDHNFPFNDMIERPDDIPPLSYLEYVKYPDKPQDLTVGQGTGKPTVGTATTESEYYKISQEDGKITVRFYEVENWSYIYLPINNFNKEYQNIKISAVGTNVQKVSFVALYAEMYDTNNPAVTTLIHDVGDTEQNYIMELGKTRLLDKSYYTMDEVLGDQTVFALCIFIDSNPTQTITNKKTEIESVFEITVVDFLKDGDPQIKEKYVDPSFNPGFYDPGYTIEKDAETKEFTINKYADAGQWESAEISVSNYSSDYTKLKMKFTTNNVKSFKVELVISGGLPNWAPNTLIYDAIVKDGEHEAYIDIDTIQPVDTTTWQPVAGYYIKNYKVIAVKFFLDTSYDNVDDLIAEDASVVISEIGFERVASEGTSITKGWVTASSSIVIGDDLAVGGVGSITYNWYESWDYLSIPVVSYAPATKLTIQLQAEELGYLGIAIASSSISLGEAVLKSCHDDLMTESEKYGDVEGVVETIVYDEATNIYTITFDFTNAAEISKYGDKTINEMPITALRFYFTDPYGDDMFEGSRTVRFISIKFE